MKLIYFYVSNGASSEKDDYRWDSKIETQNHFARQLWTEGRFIMLDKMVEKGYFQELLVFIDSNRSPGSFQITPRAKVYVVPHLKESLKYIEERDIIYARGGFKQWYSTLQTLADRKYWIMFYRANTNRGPWPFWDIVLNDLADNNYQTGNRLAYNFSKPINEKLFCPGLVPKHKRVYDVMVGASHIHTKKGQHLAINALLEYERRFGRSLSICMPGSFIRAGTNKIITDAIESNRLNIYAPGMVSRETLCSLMNNTKLFLHLGPGGQNDRGVLEAMCCGTPVMISSPSRFSSFVSNNPKVSIIASNPNNANGTAIEIKNALQRYNTTDFGESVWKYYLDKNGMEEVVIPKMAKLIDYITINPVPNRAKLLREFIV